MKTLIIPDMHNKTAEAEHVIQKENPDRTVFLGDYFDSYGEGIEFAHETADVAEVFTAKARKGTPDRKPRSELYEQWRLSLLWI